MHQAAAHLRGCGLLTGEMVVRLASVSCRRSDPSAALRMSTGCSAVPPKSSLMYLCTVWWHGRDGGGVLSVYGGGYCSWHGTGVVCRSPG